MAKLAPSVEKPVPRLRLGFVVALLLAMAAGVVALLSRTWAGDPKPTVDAWEQFKAKCTPLEAETAVRDMPSELHAVCFALAGKIDRARELLASQSPAERKQDVEILFARAHPIADAGDDRSAGPIMHLVVEFAPENYMATFHAGMADYALGNDAAAKPMLEKFLTMYQAQDVWHDRAVQALRGIETHQSLDQREAHFAE